MIQGIAPEIANWRNDYADKDAFGKQLLIDLLTNITKTGLIAQAKQSIQDFKKAIDAFIGKYGASWEDIIIRYEWREELDRIKASN